MDLMQMGLQGSIMILVVIAVRAVFLNRLPKSLFLVLWGLVLARLLIPFSIPLPWSAWTAVEKGLEATGVSLPVPLWNTGAETAAPTVAVPVVPAVADGSSVATLAPEVAHQASFDPSLGLLVWLGGSLVCAIAYGVLYVRSVRRLRRASASTAPFAQRWLASHALRRPLTIRETPLVASPLTYGVLHPVIVVPSTFPWDAPARANLMLEHEFAARG